MKRIKTEYIIFLAALMVYGATSSLYPFPGSSASLLLSHAWIYPFQLHSHPMWGMLIAALARLPLPLAATMNILSVLCGAFAIMLFYRVMHNCKLDSDYDERTPSARAMMSLAGPVYLLTLLPIWMICNRAHYASFELLLFVMAILTMQNYRRSGGLHRLAIVGLLFGFGIIESATFLVSAPVIGLYMVFLMWRNSDIKTIPIAVAAGAFLAGFALPLIPAWLYTTLPVYEWGGASNFWDSAWQTYSSSAKTLRGQVGQTGWIILLMVSIMPFVGAIWIKSSQPVENRSKSIPFIALLLIVLAGALMFNIIISPWVLLPRTIGFPLSSLLIASSFAMTIAFWTAFLKDRRNIKHHHRKPASAGGRRTEIFISILLAALLVATAIVNFKTVKPRGNSELNTLVDAMVEGIPPHDKLITQDGLDAHLIIAAFDQGINLSTINPRLATQQLYRNYMNALMKSKRAEALLDFNVRSAVREWMLSNTNAVDEIGFLGDPTWLERTKLIPLNTHGIYYGVAKADTPDLEKIFKREQPYWELMKKTFGAVDGEAQEDRPYLLNTIASLCARGINDFGVFMEAHNRVDFAREAYANAISLDPNNLSAIINLYSCLPEGEPQRAGLVSRTDKMIRKMDRLNLREIMQSQGYIASAESARKIMEIATGIKAESEPKEAAIPTKTPPEDIESFKELVEMINKGQWDKAEESCRKLIAKNLNYDKVWLLLGVVANHQKDTKTLNECLDRMVEAKKFWPELVAMAGISAKENGELKRARQLLEAVFRANLNNAKILEELLQIDMRLGGTERGKIYLSKLIEIDSENYLANFMLGSKLYEAGKYDLALTAYNKCLERSRNYSLLNNVAWIHNKLGRHEKALKLAEESIKKNNSVSSSWDTLASVLIETGKFERAEKALKRAIEIDPNSVSAKITMVELMVRTGRKKEAQALGVEIESKHDDLSFENRERLAKLLGD